MVRKNEQNEKNIDQSRNEPEQWIIREGRIWNKQDAKTIAVKVNVNWNDRMIEEYWKIGLLNK